MDVTPAALSISEAARFLGLGRTKLYELIQHGDLPVVHLGGRTLIRRLDAEALLNAHKFVAISTAEKR